MFQFHYGTIGSATPAATSPKLFSFNSTMVRLVDPLQQQFEASFRSFNSTMVRLVGD